MVFSDYLVFILYFVIVATYGYLFTADVKGENMMPKLFFLPKER